MKKIILLQGPNLNMLGQRDIAQYGSLTLSELENSVRSKAKEFGYELLSFQSNHEGDLIDMIQELTNESSAMIINPGALTHYSYAIHDAIIDSKLPTVEVHLSNIHEREPWRAHSVIASACVHSIVGKKLAGYHEALDFLVEYLKDEN